MDNIVIENVEGVSQHELAPDSSILENADII